MTGTLVCLLRPGLASSTAVPGTPAAGPPPAPGGPESIPPAAGRAKGSAEPLERAVPAPSTAVPADSDKAG